MLLQTKLKILLKAKFIDMKKIFTLAFIGMLTVFTLTACGGDEDENDEKPMEMLFSCVRPDAFIEKKAPCTFYIFPDDEYKDIEINSNEYAIVEVPMCYAIKNNGEKVRCIGVALYAGDGYGSPIPIPIGTGDINQFYQGDFYIVAFPYFGMQLVRSKYYKAKTFSKPSRSRTFIIEPSFTDEELDDNNDSATYIRLEW